MFFLKNFLSFLFVAVPILISVAYLTLAERKIMGSMQLRIGPSTVGFLGLLQPLIDGLKLLLKETILPTNSNVFGFILAPIIAFFLSLLSWCLIPFSFNSFVLDLNLSLLLLFVFSSLNVYSIIFSGWFSNSRYAFFGAIRSASQLISYEVCFSLILMSTFLTVSSLNILDVVYFQLNIPFFLPYFPLFLMFLITILAETNRAPFDLPEAESELVSGFNVEYAAMGFALFFLAEYSSIILMSCVTVLIFIGGWFLFGFTNYVFFSLKAAFLLFFFVWVRASFPRYRIDQLMRLCWKIFLPLSLSFLIFFLVILSYTKTLL